MTKIKLSQIKLSQIKLSQADIEKYAVDSKSWPFEEAKKILNKINNQTPKKGYVLFETGYGPSGLPHIGTFGEVVRTSFVRFAFNYIAPHIPTKMFCVSDDIDGLRKVPDNIPNKDLITANLGKPLTSVPDPFGTHQSYGEHMNARLKEFLNQFGFEYEFISATKKYKSGAFNETMIAVLNKYEDLMNLMLPTLGEDRQKTYSPFMPIDKESGIVIDKGVKSINKQKGTITYIDPKGEEKEISVLDGNCKLQWKIDFGARWYSLGVDYEIYGKDHQPNEKIYRQVCKILGGSAPINYTYEMFLSEDGAKISKSKGNGVSVEEWLRYAPKESLAYYMFQKPKTAKRLYFDVIPKSVDEYVQFLSNYKSREDAEKIDDSVFFIHNNEVPEIDLKISFSMLINLASACNPESDDILWGFISKYQPEINKDNSPLLCQMVFGAINYYNDFIKPNKLFKVAETIEVEAILNLKQELIKLKDTQFDASILQNKIFEVGKNYGYADKMKDWFMLLYQVLLGQSQGPRIGSFIEIFGIDNFVKLIEDKIKN